LRLSFPEQYTFKDSFFLFLTVRFKGDNQGQSFIRKCPHETVRLSLANLEVGILREVL
jgi:hypothetical protein